MERQEIIDILNNLKKGFQDYEDDVYNKIGFCNEHHFNMEREALMYQREAFGKCISDIVILIHNLINK